MIRLTTIGSGTAAPSPTRVSSAHLVEAGAVTILFDCGSGAVHRMSALRLNWEAITHLAITHFHADHISDIPTLIYAWRYGSMTPRLAPATLIGPLGFADLFTRMDEVFGGSMTELGFPLTVAEVTPGETLHLTESVQLECFKVPHSDESVAYSVRCGAHRIVYTGDTAFDPALADWASGCDVLLTECSLPANMAIASHMTPEECGELARLARPRALALTHFYPPLVMEEVATIVAERYTGPIHLTTDGWSIQLED